MPNNSDFEVKDMLDDLVTAAVVGFSAFYTLFGHQLGLMQGLMKALVPMALVTGIFYMKFKSNRRQMRKNAKEASEDNVLAYVTRKQIRRDLLLLFSVPVLMALPALLTGTFGNEDIFQVTAVFLAGLAWHRYYWRKRSDESAQAVITKNDKLKDELVLYALPVLSLGISLLFMDFDWVDAAQSLASFAPLWGSRYMIYKGI